MSDRFLNPKISSFFFHHTATPTTIDSQHISESVVNLLYKFKYCLFTVSVTNCLFHFNQSPKHTRLVRSGLKRGCKYYTVFYLPPRKHTHLLQTKRTTLPDGFINRQCRDSFCFFISRIQHCFDSPSNVITARHH